MEFEMLVDEVFIFNNGRTVFAGRVLVGSQFIKKCKCDLYSNEVKVDTFDLEGEMMPLSRTQQKVRAVATYHSFSKGDLSELPNLKLKSHPYGPKT